MSSNVQLACPCQTFKVKLFVNPWMTKQRLKTIYKRDALQRKTAIYKEKSALLIRQNSLKPKYGRRINKTPQKDLLLW